MDACVGCSAEGTHKIVGIALSDAALSGLALTEPNDRGFVAYAVCDECHRNPEHRQRRLKMAFFHRDLMKHALKNAGSNSVGGR